MHDLQFQISFEEFKLKLKPPTVKSEKQVLGEVQDIMKLFDLKGGD